MGKTFSFSLTEIKELLISAVIISFVFGYPFAGAKSMTDFLLLNLLLLFLVGLAFVLHETAHKLTAQSFGCWSEYRLWKEGLLLALFFKMLTGITFIAPGATYYLPFIHGVPFWKLGKKEVGQISAAGPVANIILAFILLGSKSFLGEVAQLGVQVNLGLAFFNLIPIPPWDGSKVMSWDAMVWLILFGGVFILQNVIG